MFLMIYIVKLDLDLFQEEESLRGSVQEALPSTQGAEKEGEAEQGHPQETEPEGDHGRERVPEHPTLQQGGERLLEGRLGQGRDGGGHEDAAAAGDAAGYAGGWPGDADQARLELRGPVPQHLREGGRQAHLPPPPGGTEHGLYPLQGRLRARPPRHGAQLVHATARHTRRGRGRHCRGAATLRRIPGTGTLTLYN